MAGSRRSRRQPLIAACPQLHPHLGPHTLKAAGVSQSPQTLPYPRAWGQGGSAGAAGKRHPPGLARPPSRLAVPAQGLPRGRSSRARSSRRREPSRGHGSTNAALAGPRSHVPTAAGERRRRSPADGRSASLGTHGTQGSAGHPQPLLPPRRSPSPGCRQSTRLDQTHPKSTFPAAGLPAPAPARQQDPPFTESWDFSQGGPALALLELAAAMASPLAGSREREDTSAPLPPRRGSQGCTGVPGQPLWARTQPGRYCKRPTWQGDSAMDRHAPGKHTFPLTPDKPALHRRQRQRCALGRETPLQWRCHGLKRSEPSWAALSPLDTPFGRLQLTLTQRSLADHSWREDRALSKASSRYAVSRPALCC